MQVVRRHAKTSSITIDVAAATGEGPTALAAFDDALWGAGVANFNLIRLSSVIPPAAVVRARHNPGRAVVDLRTAPNIESAGGWGDRLYAVWAFQSAEKLGEEAWAGVSWLQDPRDGRGLFVEHEGSSEAQVREELEASLTSISSTRGLDHCERHSVVIGARCEGAPVASLVIAPFVSQTW